jgi:hypothetical protein
MSARTGAVTGGKPRLRRTARAEEDLIEIWTYIARDNPKAADRLLDQLDRKSMTGKDTISRHGAQ